MSTAFLKYAAASVVVASVSCTPEAIMPLYDAERSGQIIEINEEEFLMGMIISPDFTVDERDDRVPM